MNYKGIKVLIFGLGLNNGGVGSAKFFAKKGAIVRVTDLKSDKVLAPSINQLKDFPDIEYSLSGHKNEDIEWADLIIKNPGVKPDNPFLNLGKKLGKRIEMDMGIFLEFVNPSQIIGVTGTKGKSTTASLIYEVMANHLRGDAKLPAGSHPGGVVLAGNIGKSVLDVADLITQDTLVILELSSFQLEAFDAHRVSPKYAVITNIYPDHLNYYNNMDEYIKAKKIIGKYQSGDDYLFINKEDPNLNNSKFLQGLSGKIVFYSASDLPLDFNPEIKGEHNKFNMAAALAVGKIFGLDEKNTLKTLARFKGVPFRLELVKVWNGVRIINDTTATGPDAAIQAIKTVRQQTASHIGSGNVVLICGGMNKGMDYKELAQTIDTYVNKVFFLEGDATDEIRKNLSLVTSHLQLKKTYNDLEKLLFEVKKEVKKGDIILFSPAATSFNLFQNEFDRGRKFNKAVERIFK